MARSLETDRGMEWCRWYTAGWQTLVLKTLQ